MNQKKYKNKDWNKENYIDFPEEEYESYKKRLMNNQIIYTTRVSKEVSKYEKNKIYNSCFGKLKVVYLKHFSDLKEHPFYDELTKKQIEEIDFYIKENGYDLIGLNKIQEK